MTPFTVTHSGHAARVVFNSRIARILGGPNGLNNAVTFGPDTIRVSRDWISREHLAHEFRHTLQARDRGWRYLPWVLWGYVTTFSHDRSPAERDADQWANDHYHEFPHIGLIPAWVYKR